MFRRSIISVMFTSYLFALTAFAVSTASAATVYQGFNYGATYTDGSAITQSGFESLFTTAKTLVGTSGFTSARLYTMIQGGTTNTPTEAIPAAISTKTSLLLGLWASAGSADFDNEVSALTTAIQQYGTSFTDLIAGISVGSEDLYRNSPIGIENLSGIGAQPTDITSYIAQVRSAIAGTAASSALVGHVDTWTAWVNGSNSAVISACDFLGVDAYPYFQNTEANSVDDGYTVLYQAYNNTLAVAGAKPVWITETGWPVSGPTENLAIASVANAQQYWDQVGCSLFGNINTWWYTLQDAYPTTPSPSFGIVGTTLSTTPLYNLTCPAPGSSKSSSESTNSTSSSSSSGTSSTNQSSATQPTSIAVGSASSTSKATASGVSTITSGAVSSVKMGSRALVGLIAVAIVALYTL